MPTSCDELLCNLRRFPEQFTRTFQIAAIVCWLLKGSGTGPFGGLSPACSAWWHHLSAIVENCAAAGVSGVDAPRSGASCIWRQWRESVVIPPSELSICGCGPMVSTPNPRSPPACASSSLFSMPCCTTKLTGKHLRSSPQPLPFLPSWARLLNTVAARWLLPMMPRTVPVLARFDGSHPGVVADKNAFYRLTQLEAERLTST